jgi:hypothetical protein
VSQQGMRVDPAELRKFRDRMSHLADLMKTDTDTLLKTMGAAAFNTRSLGASFEPGRDMDLSYVDKLTDFTSNLNDLLAAVRGLADAAADLAKSYGDATDADLLGAADVDKEFHDGPVTTPPVG